MKQILPQALAKPNEKKRKRNIQCLSRSSFHSSRARRDFAKSWQLRGDMRRQQQETSCAALSCLPAFSCCSQTPVLASLPSRTKHRTSSAAAWCFSSFYFFWKEKEKKKKDHSLPSDTTERRVLVSASGYWEIALNCHLIEKMCLLWTPCFCPGLRIFFFLWGKYVSDKHPFSVCDKISWPPLVESLPQFSPLCLSCTAWCVLLFYIFLPV